MGQTGHAEFIRLDQPTHLYSLTKLYSAGGPTSSSYLDIPKNDNGKFQKNGR